VLVLMLVQCLPGHLSSRFYGSSLFRWVDTKALHDFEGTKTVEALVDADGFACG
jgi:hypothetical protein